MFDLKGKNAIISGSAQGLGREFAERLLRQGCKVCISDINTNLGEATTKELCEKYGKDQAIFVSCDVRKQEDWDKLWDEAESRLGYISVLVNNAGINGTQGWKMSIDIMFTGVATGMYLALNKMRTSKGGQGGRIINIASLAGILTELSDMEGNAYTMAKWGVVGITRSFADKQAKLDKENIKGFALCPFFVNTQLVRDAIPISKLEKMTKTRIMTIPEAGDAFDSMMKLDKNGGILSCYPDTPLFDFPNPNWLMFFSYVLVGRIINATGLKLDIIGPGTVVPAMLVILYLAFLLVKMLLCCVF